MKVPSRKGHRRFGSVRVLRDGRVRFSEWSFPGLDFLSFTTTGSTVDVLAGSRQVLILWLDDSQRVSSACIPYDLEPGELRAAIPMLRKAGQGLERWILPALEYTQAMLASPNDQQADLVQAISDVLKSSRDLPVAPQWKRIRTNVFANAGVPLPERQGAAGKPRRRSALKPRRK